MAFTPSIQALIGDHTAQYSGNTQCAIDWTAGKAYIHGLISGTRYIARQGIFTGAQEAFASSAAFTHPPVNDTPIQFDQAGNLYLPWAGLNGGGLTRASSTTLGQLAFSGVSTSNFPLGYPGLPGGTLANIAVSGSQFILAGSLGGIFGILDYHAVFIQELFAGRQALWSGADPIGKVCAGPDGSGLGYSIVSETGSSGTQVLRVYQISCTPGGSWVVADWPTQNSLITSTELFDLLPTDIDAGWTEIHQSGLCLDQTDNNLILCLIGQSGAGTPRYYVKIDVGTGGVIWKVAIPSAAGISNSQLAFSRIANSRFAFFDNTGHTVTTINTTDGSVTTQTANLAGIVNYGYQCYNDSLGAILLNMTFSKTTGSPVQLNSTPDSYTGWTVLYVNTPLPVPPPPAPGRKFLAELGPVRIS